MRHAPLPSLCPDCTDTLLAEVEAEAGDHVRLGYCPHTHTLARVVTRAGAIVHTVLDGPVDADNAFEQMAAMTATAGAPLRAN